MQSLLRWSIEHSTPQDGSGPGDRPSASNQRLDPGIIDMILGRPDAEQMKEDVAIATDVAKSEEDRLAALDHLEMVSFESGVSPSIVIVMHSSSNILTMRMVRMIVCTRHLNHRS